MAEFVTPFEQYRKKAQQKTNAPKNDTKSTITKYRTVDQVKDDTCREPRQAQESPLKQWWVEQQRINTEKEIV